MPNTTGKKLATALTMWLLMSGPSLACSVDEAATRVQLSKAKRAGELSKQQMVLLDKIKVITAKANDPVKPLGQQLSPADANEFAQVTQRYQSIDLLQFLESDYARDISVVRDLYEVAQREYLGAPAPEKGDKNEFLYNVLLLMAVASEIEKKTPFSEPDSAKGCTLEVALHEIEMESLGRVDGLNLAQALKEMNQIAERNGGGKIDRERLNFEDRAAFDRLQRSVVPAMRERSFAVNLESLNLLTRTAALKFELGKKDTIDSGGDLKAVGNSAAELYPKLDERSKLAFNVLTKIAENYPSDWAKQKEALGKIADTFKKQGAGKPSKSK